MMHGQKNIKTVRGVKIFPLTYEENMWGLITRPVFMDRFENRHVREAAAHYAAVGLTNDTRKC